MIWVWDLEFLRGSCYFIWVGELVFIYFCIVIKIKEKVYGGGDLIFDFLVVL